MNRKILCIARNIHLRSPIIITERLLPSLREDLPIAVVSTDK